MPPSIPTPPEPFHSDADVSVPSINQDARAGTAGVQLGSLKSFTREAVWVWPGSGDPLPISLPFCHRFITQNQVGNRAIKFCDFCAASVMGSPRSVLGHLLCTCSRPWPSPQGSRPSASGNGAAAQQDLVAPIYMLISTASFPATATRQESGKQHPP